MLRPPKIQGPSLPPDAERGTKMSVRSGEGREARVKLKGGKDGKFG